MAEKIIFWQKEALRKQLSIARKLDCPVIIHSRSAFDDCVREIDGSGVNWNKVVFHCFTEGVREISMLIERGGRASFTGIITFPKNEKLLEAVKYQGLEKLMIETDSYTLHQFLIEVEETSPVLFLKLKSFGIFVWPKH